MNESITVSSERDVVDALDIGRPKSRMKWIWFLGLGGVFFEAYASAALSTGLEPLTKQLSLTPLQVSIITSSYMFVAIFLCPPAGALADRFGRVRIILIAKLFAAAAMLIGFTAANFETLLMSRLLIGVAWAMDFGVVLAYLAEWLPRRDQSKVSSWQGVWYVGTTSNLLLAVLIYEMGAGSSIWRYLLASAGIVALVLLFMQMRLCPESPRWLASKGRHEAAVKSLTTVYEADVMAGPDVVGWQGATTTKPRSSFSEIFKGEYRRRTILSSVSFVAETWQYYAIGWYLPVIALELFGEGFVAATLGTVGFNILGIIGGFASATLARRFMVRRAAAIGYAACTVVLVVFGLTFGHLPILIAALLPALFILFQSGFAGPSGANLSALAYPSRLRALGTGFCTTACNIGAAAGLFSFPLLMETLGTKGAITATAVIPLIAFLVMISIRWDPEITPDIEHAQEGYDRAGQWKE